MNSRSHNSLLRIWRSLADHYVVCGLLSEVTISKICERYATEGEGLFVKELPQLGKSLLPVFKGERFLAPQGFITDHYGRPILMKELFTKIIGKDGYLNKDYTAIHLAKMVQCVNQLTLCFYKLERPATADQKQTAVDKLIQNNGNCSAPVLNHAIIDQASALIHKILCGVDPYDISPKYNTGSVAERGNTLAHRITSDFEWPDDLAAEFPKEEYGYLNLNHLVDEWEIPSEDLLVEPIPARVSFVPKDARGPRMIFCEPIAKQFIQQGLMAKLYETISKTVLRRGSRDIPLKDCMPLKSQDLMQDLAKSGSITGLLSTIDLEAASDTVSNNLVKRLFPKKWYTALSAARSKEFQLTETLTIRSNIFAPMGASVCFPVETLVFWALATSACLDDEYVYAYGDDLIVPTQSYNRIVYILEWCGFKVNENKSFSDGPFRESCGGDFLFGESVNYVKYRKNGLTPEDKESQIQFVNNCIAMYGNTIAYGYPTGEGLLISTATLLCPRTLCGSPSTIRLPGTDSINYVQKYIKWNSRFQEQYLYYSGNVPIKEGQYDGWAGLFHNLLSMPASKPLPCFQATSESSQSVSSFRVRRRVQAPAWA